MMRSLLALAASFALLFSIGAASTAAAQANYPAAPINLVVPFAPGGSTDVAARVMAKHLGIALGVRVNIVNRGGGNQIPAVLSVLTAPPDGYTLLVENSSTSSAHSILKDLPYKWQDRTWGPMMAQGQHAFVVTGKSPINSLRDLMAQIKAEPSNFTWTYLGGGTVTDFVIAQLIGQSGVEVKATKPVAFDGGGPGVVAVAGGHINLSAVGVSAVLPLRSSGDLKVLAVTGERRAPSLPDVPTVKEAGAPGVDMTVWWSISGPKNMPKMVLDRLDGAARKVVQDPAYIKDQQAVSNQPKYLSPAETEQFVIREAGSLRTLSERLRPAK